MTEVKKIKQELARNGDIAYEKAKNSTGAYVMRGNSIVKVTADGSIHVEKKLGQVKVRIKDSDRVVVMK